MSDGKVYVMQDGTGLVKIGRSRSPEGRVKTLATGNPSIKLIFSTGMLSNAAKVEAVCHKKLKGNEVASEWFECSASLAIQTVNAVVSEFGDAFNSKTNPRGDEEVIKRLNSAVGAGIKASAIARSSGITLYRLASVINPESYRGSTKFNEEEAKKIESALDQIKNSF